MFKPHLQLQPHLRVILSLANITGTVRYPIKYGTTPRLRIMVGGTPLLMLANFWGWIIRCQLSIQRWKGVVKPLDRG